MGNIKPTFVKRGAEKIMKEHASEITKDFDTNQEIVKKYIVANKFIMNKVAGYLTRKEKNKGKKRTYVPKKPERNAGRGSRNSRGGSGGRGRR